MHFLEQLVRADHGKQLERVVDSVYLRLFFKILIIFQYSSSSLDKNKFTHLIEGAHRRHEDNSIRVIEVRYPCVSLAACPADIVKMPENAFAGDLYHELV